MRVREAMNRRPPTVREHATLAQALALLDRHRVSVLPVVDSQVRLCGVVSEADLERRPRAGADWGVPRVRDVMFRHPLTVLDDSDLDEAVYLMTSTSLRYLPVVDRSDVVVGLLSRQELVRLVPHGDPVLELRRSADPAVS